jgi:lysozyme family protein
MRELPLDLAKRIYMERYWRPVRADELPAGVRYAVFDAAVNSGPGQAVKWLQRAAGVADDGVLGPKTLAAVNALNADSLRSKILAQRLRFMSSLPNWPAFSRGWSRRIADLMEA